jgi:hypothetical protein
MKNKLLIITIMALFCMSAHTQIIETRTRPIINGLDSVKYELSYTRECLFKFHRQHRTAIIMQISGALAAVILPKDNDLQYNRMVYLASGVVCLTGFIVELDSYKWIKRATLTPTPYGVSLNIMFDPSPMKSDPMAR